MPRRPDLTGLLDHLKDCLTDDPVRVEDLIAAAEERGFGPLLLVPALLVLTPIGAIPLVPTLMALLNTLIAAQLLIGRRHPWLPRRLRRVKIARQRFEAAHRRATPITARIDRLLYPRLTLLTKGPAPRLVAALVLVLGLVMIPLELVPFAAAVPAFAIVLMGLGLSVRDGLLIVLGLAFAAAGLTGIWFLQRG